MQTVIQGQPDSDQDFIDMMFIMRSLRSQGYGVTLVANDKHLTMSTNAPVSAVAKARSSVAP